MSLQKNLESSSILIRRKLFDNQIALMGKSTSVARLKTQKNKYGDGNVEVIASDIIECVINYPGEVPLNRLRDGTGTDKGIVSEGIFLFDIIPIDIYTKWEDKVEKGDFIIDTVRDEQNNLSVFVLQISDMVGTFQNSLLWRKGLCSPHNGALPEKIKLYISQIKDFKKLN